MSQDKRQHDRYSVSLELEGKALNALESARVARGTAPQEIYGEVADISEGGLCLLTVDAANVSEPVRCVIRVPQIPAGIPTLLQVRWTRKDGLGPAYRVGLQFLV
ncbi:MAG: PilZ domain-containing protein [Acidobacteria bacterium]|nr:MAG: PilZ domain-containing protein [Acidobacteriota bacterium]